MTSRPDQEERAPGNASTVSGPSSQSPLPRPYATPSLTAYGRLTDLTRFGGSIVVDSGGGLGPQP